MELIPVVKNQTCNVQVLQEILTRYWDQQIVVTHTETEPATAKGNNFVSDAWRVRFTYHEQGSEETKTETLIVKSKLADDAQNALMHAEAAFDNEILAYEHVIPTLNNFMCGILRVPKYLHGDQTSIVLEDMNNRSFRSIHKKLAVEWNQVWSPIQEMAKLHAASIVFQALSQDKFKKLTDKIRHVSHSDSEDLGVRQITVLDTLFKILDDSQTAEAEKFKVLVESLKKDAWKQQKELIEKEDIPVRVINHGSIWINNLLYRGDMITLLDWQHIVFSSPAIDLSYFLYVNLDTDFLSNNKSKLIDFYLVNLHQSIYDSSVNRMTIQEIDAVLSPLTHEWIAAEVKRCSFYAYMMALWITPVFYWSEAIFKEVENHGGFESMSVEERLRHMTSDQKDRVVKLTKFYLNESNLA